MELTRQLVQSFIGGQVEIQNTEEEYLYRGEIESIDVAEDELRVKFVWLAKGEGFPPIPHKWVKDDNLEYSINLSICVVDDIGPSDDVNGSNRICVDCPVVGETIILYPPDGSKLDPAKVQGLELTKK